MKRVFDSPYLVPGFLLLLCLLGILLSGCSVRVPVYQESYGHVVVSVDYEAPPDPINLWHADAPTGWSK